MVVMGRVTAPHGVLGWVRVQAFTEARDGLAEYPVWWLRGSDGWVRWKVEAVARHSQGLAAKLEGCDDRDAAEELAKLDIAVPRDALPETGAEEYYWADLIGLEVLNVQGEPLGTVVNLIATGANDVLVVQGDRERLIPFIASVVIEVDKGDGQARGRLIVDWGLDY
jgi:16S rRNA processing protein RimM